MLEGLPRKMVRSEEIATGGAPDGGDLYKSVVIGRGSWEDGGGNLEPPGANTGVDPQGPDGVNEVRRSSADRLIGSPFINKFSCDDELELWSPSSFPCAAGGTLAVAGRIFLT